MSTARVFEIAKENRNEKRKEKSQSQNAKAFKNAKKNRKGSRMPKRKRKGFQIPSRKHGGRTGAKVGRRRGRLHRREKSVSERLTGGEGRSGAEDRNERRPTGGDTDRRMPTQAAEEVLEDAERASTEVETPLQKENTLDR